MFNVYEPQCKVKVEGSGNQFYPVLIIFDKDNRTPTELTIQRYTHLDRKSWGDLRLHMSLLNTGISANTIGWDKILQHTFTKRNFVADSKYDFTTFRTVNGDDPEVKVLFDAEDKDFRKYESGFMIWLRGDTTYKFGSYHKIKQIAMSEYEGHLYGDGAVKEKVKMGVMPNDNYISERWRVMYTIGG